MSQILSAGWGGWKCPLKLGIKAFTLEAERLHSLPTVCFPPTPSLINAVLIVHVLWCQLEGESVACPCRSTGSGKPELPWTPSREGANAHCHFYRLQERPTCVKLQRGFPQIIESGSRRSLPEATPVCNTLGKGPTTDKSQAGRGAMRTGERAWDSAVRSWEPASGASGQDGLQKTCEAQDLVLCPISITGGIGKLPTALGVEFPYFLAEGILTTQSQLT